MSEQLTAIRERVLEKLAALESYYNTFPRVRKSQYFEMQFPALTLADDLIRPGWSVAIIDGIIQDVPMSRFDVSKLRPRSFFLGRREVTERLEASILGEELSMRALWFGGQRGLADLKYIQANQKWLSNSFRFRGSYIPGTGTKLITSEGHLVIPYLYLDDDENKFLMDFNFLHYEWSDKGRFAV